MSWDMKMFITAAVGSVAAMFYPELLRAFGGEKHPVAFSATAKKKRLPTKFIAGVVIGVIAAALGFQTFLSANNKKALETAGLIAYFTAFTFGFASGSVAEEPLKPKK